MKKNISVNISGKVQGVWFRYFAQKEGEKLKLNGYVCNLDDGSVLIKASGPQKELDRLISWCHIGSPLSKVERVTVNEISDKFETAFHIK